MAGSFEKDLKLIFSFVKDQSKYDIPKITNDLVALRGQLDKIRPLLDNKFSFKIEGLKELKDFKNTIVSLSRTLGPVVGKMQDFTRTVNGIRFQNADVAKVTQAIDKLSAALGKFSIKEITSNFDSFVRVLEKVNAELVTAIKPLDAFTASLDRLDQKIKTSLQDFSKFANVAKFLQESVNQATAQVGKGGSVNLRVTPRSQEADIGKLIGDYERLSSQIDRASASVDKFNQEQRGATVDSATRKQVLDNVRLTRKAYDDLRTTAGQLNTQLAFLETSETADIQILERLRGVISQLNSEESRRLAQLAAVEKANLAVAKSDVAVKKARDDSFSSLSGNIVRQAKFIASFAALAAAGDFVRKGFESTFQILDQVQKVLTVSRSAFLSTAQTAKLLGETMVATAQQTGETTQNVAVVLKELGSAGLTTEQSIAALDSTLNNIIATDSSVVETTRLVASTFNILGTTVAETSDQAANFARINDVFARAANESSLEMDQLVQALKFSLPAAKESGLRLEDLTAVLGQLADQGLRGGNAGRALRATLQQLSTDAPKVAKALNIDIPLDKPLAFLDIIEQFSEKIKGQQLDVEQLGAVFDQFGLRGADVFLLLAQNIDKVRDKIQDLDENSQGEAAIKAQLRIESPERQFEILGQNIAELSRNLFAPLIELVLTLTRELNNLANVIRDISASGFGRIIIAVTQFAAALGAVIFVLPKIVAFITTAAKAFTGLRVAIATASVAQLGFAGVLAALNPVLAAIGVALGAAAAAYLYFADSAERSLRKVQENTLQLQRGIAENRKFIKSYGELADRIRKGQEDLAKGNLTQEQYNNLLNQLADSSPEVADLILSFGNNVEKLTEQLGFLTAAREADNEALIAQQQALNLSSLGIRTEELEKTVSQLQTLRAELDSTAATITKTFSAGFSAKIQSGSAGADLPIAKKFVALRQSVNEASAAYQKQRTELLALTATAPELAEAVRSVVSAMDAAIGNTAGLSKNVIQLVDPIKKLQQEVNGFDVAGLVSDIKDLKDVGQAFTGLGGLRTKLLLEANLVIPDEEFERIRGRFEKDSGVFPISLDAANLDEVAKQITDIFGQIPNNVGPSVARVRKELQGILADGEKFSDETERVAFLNGEIAKSFSIMGTSIVALNSDSKNSAQIAEKTLSVQEQISKLFGNQRRSAEFFQQAGLLENNRLALRNALEVTHAALLKKSAEIFRDTEADAANQLSISVAQLKELRESLRLQELQEKIANRSAAQAAADFQRLQALQTQEAAAVKKQTQDAERLRQIQKQIQRSLELATVETSSFLKLGASAVSQARTELALSAKRAEFIQRDLKAGYNSREQLTAALALTKERLVTQLKLSEAVGTERQQALKAQEELLELSRDDITTEAERARLMLQQQAIQEQLAQLRLSSELLDQKDNEKTLKEVALTTELLKKQKEVYALDLKRYDNQLRLNELQRASADQTAKITAEASDKLQEPLRKFFAQRLESSPFSAVLDIGNRLGLSFSEVSGYFDNTEALLDRFFRAVKEGKADLAGLPAPIRAAAEAMGALNAQLERQREEQNKLQQQRFDTFQRIFDTAIARGGAEGFNQAAAALQNMGGAIAFVNKKTGEADLGANAEAAAKLAAATERFSKRAEQGFSSDFLQQYPAAAAAAAAAQKQLNDVLVTTRTELDDANTGLRTTIKLLGDLLVLQSKFGVLGVSARVEQLGGALQKRSGGVVPGSGSGDIVPALLEPGEFVIPRDVVRKRGLQFFENLIGGSSPRRLGGDVARFQAGGLVGGEAGAEGASTGLQSLQQHVDIVASVAVSSLGVLREIRDGVFFTVQVLKDIRDQSYAQVLDFSLGVLKDIRLQLSSKSLTSSELKAAPGEQLAGFAFGGFVPGSGTGDTVPALLEPGEFVIPKAIVQQRGAKFFQDLISGDLLGFSAGGLVSAAASTLVGGQSNSEAQKDANEVIKLLKEISDGIRKSPAITGNVPQPKGLSLIEASPESASRAADITAVRKNAAEILKEIDQLTLKTSEYVSTFSASFTTAFNKFKDELGILATRSDSVFKRMSARAAQYIVAAFENIENTITDFFAKSVPDFLSFFLEKVVLSNAKVLVEYEKQRKKLQDNYRNQKGDLIEQLKRNEISYFDFFDKLEDLQDDQNKSEVDLAKEKNDALTQQLKDQLKDVAGLISGLSSSIVTFISKGIASLPAVLDVAGGLFKNVFDSISKGVAGITNSVLGIGEAAKGVGGAIGAGIGGAIGAVLSAATGFADLGSLVAGGATIGAGIGDAVAGIAESVLGAVVGPLKIAGEAILTVGSTVFDAAFQGFSQLLPLVLEIGAFNDDEFQAFLTQLDTLPGEISTIANNIADRLPIIADKLVEALPDIANAFADAIQKVFTKLIPAFGKIVTAAVFAVQPIIVQLFSQIPEFIAQVSLVVLGLLPAVVTLIQQFSKRFFDFLIQDLPRIGTGFVSTFKTIVSEFQRSFLQSDLFGSGSNSLVGVVSQSVTELAPVFSGLFEAAAPVFATAVSETAPTVTRAFAQEAPKIAGVVTREMGNAILQAVVGSRQPISDTMSEAAREFLAGVKGSLSGVLDFLTKSVVSLFDTVSKELDSFNSPQFDTGGIDQKFFDDLIAGIPDLLVSLFDQFQEFVFSLGDILIRRIPEILIKLDQALLKIVSKIFGEDIAEKIRNTAKVVYFFVIALEAAVVGVLALAGYLYFLPFIGTAALAAEAALLAMAASILFMLSPIGLVIGAIGGLVVALAALFTAVQVIIAFNFAEIFQKTVEKTFAEIQAIADRLAPKLQAVKDAFDNIGRAITRTFKPLADLLGLTGELGTSFSLVGAAMEQINPLLEQAGDAIGGFLEEFLTRLGAAFQTVADRISYFGDKLELFRKRLEETGVIDRLNKALEQTKQVLEPIVNFLLPGLYVILGVLAVILGGPLFLAFEGLLLVLDVVIGGLNAFLFVMDLLQPVIEFITPGIIALINALAPLAPYVIALAVVLFALIGPFGPLIGIIGAVALAVFTLYSAFMVVQSVIAGVTFLLGELAKVDFGKLQTDTLTLLSDFGNSVVQKFQDMINGVLGLFPPPPSDGGSGNSNAGQGTGDSGSSSGSSSALTYAERYARNTDSDPNNNVPWFHDGGLVSAASEASANRQQRAGDIPAMLQDGEFVVNRKATENVGQEFLEALNALTSGGMEALLAGAGASNPEEGKAIITNVIPSLILRMRQLLEQQNAAGFAPTREQLDALTSLQMLAAPFASGSASTEKNQQAVQDIQNILANFQEQARNVIGGGQGTGSGNLDLSTMASLSEGSLQVGSGSRNNPGARGATRDLNQNLELLNANIEVLNTTLTRGGLGGLGATGGARSSSGAGLPDPSTVGRGTNDSDVNANTIKYYLDNFFRGEALSSGSDSGNSTDDGFTTDFGIRSDKVFGGTSEPIYTDRGGAKEVVSTGRESFQGQQTGGAFQNGGSRAEQPISFSISMDFTAANFTSEDAAQKVEQALVEKFNNGDGELARVLRDMTKNKNYPGG